MDTKDRIRQLRLALNLTQQEFAEKISVSAGHVSGLERGTKKLNDRSIQLMKIAFSVNEEWLKTGHGEMFDYSSNLVLTDISKAYEALDPTLKEVALQQLEILTQLNETLKLKNKL